MQVNRALKRMKRMVLRSATDLLKKRKVGSSILSLTTHQHQRIYACGLRKHRCQDRLTVAPPRPFQTSDARCAPMLGARRVHGCVWMQNMGTAEDRLCPPRLSACPPSHRAGVVRPGCCTSLLYSPRLVLAADQRSQVDDCFGLVRCPTAGVAPRRACSEHVVSGVSLQHRLNGTRPEYQRWAEQI
jgi:hypothetical protein